MKFFVGLARLFEQSIPESKKPLTASEFSCFWVERYEFLWRFHLSIHKNSARLYLYGCPLPATQEAISKLSELSTLKEPVFTFSKKSSLDRLAESCRINKAFVTGHAEFDRDVHMQTSLSLQAVVPPLLEIKLQEEIRALIKLYPKASLKLYQEGWEVEIPYEKTTLEGVDGSLRLFSRVFSAFSSWFLATKPPYLPSRIRRVAIAAMASIILMFTTPFVYGHIDDCYYDYSWALVRPAWILTGLFSVFLCVFLVHRLMRGYKQVQMSLALLIFFLFPVSRIVASGLLLANGAFDHGPAKVYRVPILKVTERSKGSAGEIFLPSWDQAGKVIDLPRSLKLNNPNGIPLSPKAMVEIIVHPGVLSVPWVDTITVLGQDRVYEGKTSM